MGVSFRVVVFSLVAGLALLLSGCGGKNDGSSSAVAAPKGPPVGAKAGGSKPADAVESDE